MGVQESRPMLNQLEDKSKIVDQIFFFDLQVWKLLNDKHLFLKAFC